MPLIPSKKPSSREIVLFILKDIYIDQHSFAYSEDLLCQSLSSSERAWVKAFTYGLCREFFSLEKLAKTYVTQPLKFKDLDVFLILIMGLYELRCMSTAKHAAVFETVNLLDQSHTQKPWAKGLINACLRKDLRENPELQKIYGPAWWQKLIQKYYPKNFEPILKNSQEQAPLFLRINAQKTFLQDYLKRLENLNISAHPVPNSKIFIQLNSPVNIQELPGFSEGVFYIQDISLQYVPELLNLSPNLKILDACAAPGGKSLHLLETEPSLDLLCLDSDEKRLERLQENFYRYQLKPKILCADAATVNFGSSPDPIFDRILLDPPCSATGVIRRHPDILLLRRESDLKELSELQLTILNNLSQYLKPNGLLLYTTCSLIELENDQVIKLFLKRNPNFISLSAQLIKLPVGNPTYLGWQILPGETAEHHGDGFYYSVLKKMS